MKGEGGGRRRKEKLYLLKGNVRYILPPQIFQIIKFLKILKIKIFIQNLSFIKDEGMD